MNRLTRGKALVGALSIDAQDITISDDLQVGDTANVTGNFSVNTNKFTVTASSGNTAVDGTLAVKGNVAVNTNKFTVAASSGNVVAAGSLQAASLILGTKAAFIADPAGATTDTDVEARAAIVSILDALIATGIIAAS